MKKSIISCILCLILVISSIPVAYAADDGSYENFKEIYSYSEEVFNDVSTTDWFQENVAAVYNLGLMNGIGNSLFNPYGNVTQAEALTMAARIHKIYTTGNDDFSDIKQEMEDMKPTILEWVGYDTSNPAYQEFYNSWYSVYAYYDCYYIDPAHYPIYPFIGAVPEKTFIDGQAPISREEFAVYLAHALPEATLASEGINEVEDNAIPDVKENDGLFGYNEIYTLYRTGIMIGSDGNGTFYPQSSITRAEAAAVLSRIAVPALRKNCTYKTARWITADKTELSISGTESVLITISGNYQVTCSYYPNMVSIKWGNWNGYSVPLEITPKRSGTTTLEVYLVDYPEVRTTITVNTTFSSGISQNEKLLRMAALGIDAAYHGAKYPSTLHLNCVTYDDNFVNGHGDTITRMVLRCYASNSMGGYGDLYVVVLCCEYETDYLDFYCNGMYCTTSIHSKNPGMEDTYLDNSVAMNAYMTYIANPHNIPYD